MWIELNVFLYDRKLDEMGIKDQDDQDDIPAKATINTNDIIGYRERMVNGELRKDSCIIFLRNGDNYAVDVPYKEMQAKLGIYEIN